MLKTLSIKQLVLMESCTIDWVEGFSVLTGETGAGKTAILQALRLLLGQKLDTSIIRSGEKKGGAEAIFSATSPEITSLLLSHDVEPEEGMLTLRRDVFADGRSKSFINGQSVPLSLLQKVASHLIQIVDQSSHNQLRTGNAPLHLLDTYGGLTELSSQFSQKLEHLKQQKEHLQELSDRERQKEREMDFYLSQEKELSDISLEPGDEEKLFEEYATCCRMQEVEQKAQDLLTRLSDLPAALGSCKNACQSLSTFDKSFQDSWTYLEQSTSCLQEALFSLRTGLSSIDTDPKRIAFLENTLNAIEHRKKKYGPSIEDWHRYRQNLREKIDLFSRIEEDKEQTLTSIATLEQELSSLSQLLTLKRTQAAQALSLHLKSQFLSLNMEQATLEILVKPQQRTSTGEDLVSFWLRANTGESFSNIQEGSSGGELARIFLACKICLAEKNETPTLIFDEIDANVGGETAAKIGKQLVHLSAHRQIICITHFPQVACQAHLHLKVQKETSNERTFTTIETITQQERANELLRMLGGNSDLEKNRLKDLLTLF